MAADTFNHERHQKVTGVAVGECAPGGVVWSALTHDRCERIIARRTLGEGAAAEQQELDVAAQTADVVHELAQCYGIGVSRQLGDELADAVIEAEPAIAGE